MLGDELPSLGCLSLDQGGIGADRADANKQGNQHDE